MRLVGSLLLFISFIGSRGSQQIEIDPSGNAVETKGCDDENYNCEMWASKGECDANPKYMLRSCRRSCGTCNIDQTTLQKRITAAMEAVHQKKEEARIKKENYGVIQEVFDEGTEKHWSETHVYMRETVWREEKYEEVRDDCENKHTQCTFWAAQGECEANQAYMHENCRVACRQCHKLVFTERCPWGDHTYNVWEAGDLERMFSNITKTREGAQISVLSKDPWVVTIDDFLTEEETSRLIALGKDRGYERSKDVGEKKADGTYGDYENPFRTSTNTWCLGKCYGDEVTKRVISKIENLTGVPDAWAEYLQLLQYEIGQFYGIHHDYIEHLKTRAEGVRIVTVFLYLNDVEGGGGTNFPMLNITVNPKRGRALLWPSVLNDHPHEKDERTDHQALPVEKGTKYGANAWLHMRDFKEPYARGCA